MVESIRLQATDDLPLTRVKESLARGILMTSRREKIVNAGDRQLGACCWSTQRTCDLLSNRMGNSLLPDH
jgi:hypothetical protein